MFGGNSISPVFAAFGVVGILGVSPPAAGIKWLGGITWLGGIEWRL